MAVVGVPLGILIGLISVIVLLLLIRTSVGASAKQLPAIVAELLAIPTFWFGGPWLTATFLQNVDRQEILPSYILALTCTFVCVALFPLGRFVIRIGNEISRMEGQTNA